MASSDSSRVDPHTSDVPPHTFSDNPPHTSDADIVGPSADNRVDSHKIPTNTEHQELKIILFVTKGIMLTVNEQTKSLGWRTTTKKIGEVIV
ncbi:hypothetical protein HanXRQr2_Chr10g0431821 [Helianthus annuus]|uniref:Uncharacterized protein n=1 Tax=Helianthus annuus TaxID=4232 RepID=A0A251TLP9_HELAN|nr:hypothetical protein HanXRQr2_Chr10g0431821 [Helianthus annuus]